MLQIIYKEKGEIFVRKLLGIFLSFSLIMTMFSTTAYAEENAVPNENNYLSEELENNSQSDFVESKSVDDEQAQKNVEKTENLMQEENANHAVEKEIMNSVTKKEKEVTYEAKIGETFYATLKEALMVGGEVTLLKDVSVNEIIEITQDTTLDLGDFTITDNAAKRPFVVLSLIHILNASAPMLWPLRMSAASQIFSNPPPAQPAIIP